MEPLIVVLPIFYAAILWWFTTGLIMAVYRSSRAVIRGWFAVATVVMLSACAALFLSAQQTDLKSVYLSYTCGVAIWGWIVAAYYLDFVTGPKSPSATREADVTHKLGHGVVVNSLVADNPVPMALGQDDHLHSPSSSSPLPHLFPSALADRFRMALRTSIHHELLALGMALVLTALTSAQPNRWGLWIFLALWLMHTSAKVNVFLGVRNFQVDFLPEHLHYLERLITKRANNAFFPFSICLASSVVLTVLYQAIVPGASATQVSGSLLIVTMLTLGIIEHWLLVMPLPAMIWGWGVRKLPAAEVTEFHLADVPLYRLLARLLTIKWDGVIGDCSIEQMACRGLTGERHPTAMGALSKPVIES